MLAKRIIPCLDVRNGRVVKGKQFQGLKDVDDPVKLGKRYSQEGADELVFYDITATHEGRDIFTNVVQSVAKEISIPFTVGGGVRTIEDFHRLLKAGADKVSVNSAAITNPDLITEAAKIYGRQCVVLSIDAKRDGNSWKVYSTGGRKATDLDAVEWAKLGEKLGAGEICMNSMDQDGETSGYDLELNKALTSVLTIPVIASGGAGKREDFVEVFKYSQVDAALAASVFHYNTLPIPELKDLLIKEGIPMRKC